MDKFTEGDVIPTLEQLVRELHKVFDEDTVDVDHVKALLRAYKSNPRDWKKYAFFDPHRYTRNLVDTGNGKFNLIALCWGEGHGSSVHDHSDAHCFVKVLQGELKETLYAWPPADSTTEEPLMVIGTTVYGKDGVTYINDDIGLHRMENPSHTEGAVTLHLYCPPFGSCHTFDEKTGHERTVKVTFTSVGGSKIPVQTVNECSLTCAVASSTPVTSATN